MNTPSNTISPELSFLIDCVAEGKLSSDYTSSDLHINSLCDLIETHRLHSIAYHSIVECDEESALVKSLQPGYTANKLKQLQLTAELILFNELMRSYNIETIAFKGPVLSSLLFDDPAFRSARDIDVLVKINDLESVISLLESIGYQKKTQYSTPKQYQTILRYFHHIEVFNPEKGILIEIHWRLSSVKSFNLTAKSWETKTQINLSETSLYTLDNQLRIVYLCVHGVKHCFFRLQWLLDLKILLSNLSSDELRNLHNYVKSTNTDKAFYTTYALLQRLVNYSVPQEIEQGLNDKKINKLTALCAERIMLNKSPEKSFDYTSRWDRFILNHKINYLLDGFPGLWYSLTKRNVRPDNWKIFAFPDRVFFLNHLFSRVIWIVGLILKKK